MVLIVATAHFGFDFSSPFIPIYVQQLGVRDPGEVAVWSGVLIGVSPLVASVAAPLWGLLADRWGPRFLVMRSLVGFTVCLFLMAFAANPVQLLGLRLLMGIFGGFTPLATALVAIETPRTEVSKALGAVQAAQFVPLATAPLVGGLVVDAFGVRSNFLASSGLLALAVGLLVLTGRRQKAEVAAPEPTAAHAVGRLSFVLVPLLVGIFAARFVERSFLPIVPLFLQQVGTTAESLASTTGLVHSAGAIAVAISAAMAGRLAARRNPMALLMASLLGGAAVVAFLALATSALQFLVLRVLVGLLAGGAMTLIYTAATQLLPREHTGRFFGLAASAGLLAGAIGPPGTGVLAAVQLEYVFLLDAALYGISALALLAWLRRARQIAVTPERPAAR